MLSVLPVLATRLARAAAVQGVADRIANLGEDESGTSSVSGHVAEDGQSGSEKSLFLDAAPSLTLAGLEAPFKAQHSLTTPEAWRSFSQSAKGSQNLFVK